jgi:hypothetical protein
VDFFKTDERKSSIYTGGSGIPTRVTGGPSRQTLSVDGFFGPDGVPISSEAGTENKSKKERPDRIGRVKLMKEKILSHPITLLWCVLIPIMGAIIQGFK